jgi:hypothetical protein
MKNILIIFLLISLFGCNSPQEKTEIKEKSKPFPAPATFRAYLKKFKMLSLPQNFILHKGIDVSGLMEVESNTSDTLYLEDKVNYFYYGMLPDTSDYYSVILLYPADVIIPVLYTYDKNGKFIANKFLVAKGCGFGCGINYCSSYASIDDKLEITLTDTNDYFICDDNEMEMKDKRFYLSRTQNGKVEKDGKIVFGELEEKDLMLE